MSEKFGSVLSLVCYQFIIYISVTHSLILLRNANKMFGD